MQGVKDEHPFLLSVASDRVLRHTGYGCQIDEQGGVMIGVPPVQVNSTSALGVVDVSPCQPNKVLHSHLLDLFDSDLVQLFELLFR
jgi:hypothetical protein